MLRRTLILKASFGIISVALSVLAGALSFHSSQDGSTISEGLTTAERLQTPGWWPTKQTVSPSEFAGSTACAKCHSKIATSQKTTAMANTLMRAANSPSLREASSNLVRLHGYTYTVPVTLAGNPTASARSQTGTVSFPLTWAFGSGEISQVYLSQQGTKSIETHFSYFNGLHGYALTPGQVTEPESLGSAVGRDLSPAQLRKCLTCHSTGMTLSTPSDPSRVTAGVSCEQCHGPGAKHIAAVRSGSGDAAALIVNPERLKPIDSVEFCGACHQTTSDVIMSDVSGTAIARFPVFRLQSSRCWGTRGDSRITCMACHDPHVPLVQEAAAYDSKCLRCHVQGGAKPTAEHPGAPCPRSNRECVTCHMPKYDIEDTHYKFTDHMIRVVKAGNPPPL